MLSCLLQKSPNPSSREIVEEVVQTAHLHLDNAIQEQNMHLDERFDMVSTDLQK